MTTTHAPESPLLAGLNEPQREAVAHLDGPLLILAGAGSGKTRVLTHRVAYLIREAGVRPDEVLAITFTNKAAGEMKARIEGLVGSVARTMWISTFHSMCARILRKEAQRLGYKSSFTIHDEDDRRRLIKRCMDELELDTKRFAPEAVGRVMSDAKNQLQGPEEFREGAAGFFAKTVADIYDVYQKRLLQMNAMDFDDLLMNTVYVLERFPARLEHYRRAFRYILIDEYQDTNHAQYRLANLLAGERANIAVVGDDDQSIYSWRGADIRNILEFERDYPSAKVIRLEQNYRSTQPILDVANAVVKHNRRRKGKNLWTGRGEGSWSRSTTSGPRRSSSPARCSGCWRAVRWGWRAVAWGREPACRRCAKAREQPKTRGAALTPRPTSPSSIAPTRKAACSRNSSAATPSPTR